MTRFHTRHCGFTLVELLAVMAIMATLAAITMLAAPGILAKDRSVEATTQMELWLQIARARAQRDKLPRGIRLIVDPTKQPNEQLWVTEVQQIESPPVLVMNMNPPYPNGPTSTLNAFVEFRYAAAPVGANGGTITSRQCLIRGLDAIQAMQIIANAPRQPTLWMPTLGSWHHITAASMSGADVLVILDQYPDTQFGALGPTTLDGTPYPIYRTYHFGIYNPPIPLMGEPTMLLPVDTCIDLNPNVSSPSGTTANDYDILFAPNGQLAFTGSTSGAGHVFLWVRNPLKTPSLDPAVVGAWGTPGYTAALQQGGEMMIIAIKGKTGAIGAAPVNWPEPSLPSPYYFAQKAVVGP